MQCILNIILTIGTHQYIKIDDMTIERKTKSKFWGVIIDEVLTWNEHLHHVTMSISKCIGIISRLKFILPHATLFVVYGTLVFGTHT